LYDTFVLSTVIFVSETTIGVWCLKTNGRVSIDDRNNDSNYTVSIPLIPFYTYILYSYILLKVVSTEKCLSKN